MVEGGEGALENDVACTFRDGAVEVFSEGVQKRTGDVGPAK